MVSFSSGGAVLNIAVVDDSSVCREQLAAHIHLYAKQNSAMLQLSEYENGETFLEQTRLEALDVVFLDIFMDGLNGIDVAYKIREKTSQCHIVFVSTSADFAVKSYELRAFYYLLKPFGYKDVQNVLNLLEDSFQKASRYLKVKEGRDWCKILLSEILYADYSNHYVQIHTESAIISTYMNFPRMEEMLAPYSEFLSCYRCIVVNMNKIKKVDGFFFLISNGEYIPINRKKAKEIKSKYVDYIFGIVEGEDPDDR